MALLSRNVKTNHEIKRDMSARLVLLRHGQSEWNLENRFTGYRDVALTVQGRNEAGKAGARIAGADIIFDTVFSSTLKRAIDTAAIALKAAGQSHLLKNMIQDDALCERDYGDLTGQNKDEARAQYGEEQVHIWRRSFDVPPPGGESLKDVLENRVRPYYKQAIRPELEQDRDVLIVAHGNSLRAMMIILGDQTPETINDAELPTGMPLVFDLKDGAIGKRHFLREEE